MTQTFDDKLELPFPGISSGKYLITVDGKYVFFKEIISIQNVNKAQVELKQWLYKNGNPCEHNTGGWMKCECIAQNRRAQNSYTYYDAQSLSSNAALNAENMVLSGSGYGRAFNNDGSREQRYYGRAGYYLRTNVGTATPMKQDISLYSALHTVISGSGLTASFRTGSPNSSGTNISTATVIKSGAATSLDLSSIINEHPYLVLGINMSADPVAGTGTAGYPDNSHSYNTTITEIYLT